MQINRKVDVLELTENQVPAGNVIDTIKHPYFDFLSPKTLEKGLNAMKMMSRRVTIISLLSIILTDKWLSMLAYVVKKQESL